MSQPSPRLTPVAAGLLLLIVLTAAGFRLPHLARRPMHADEAVHAAKLEELLARGVYVYNPREFHGPVLYDFNLPILTAAGIRDWTEIPNAARLRIVPALFGIGLIPLLLLIRRGLGNRATLFVAFFVAISPAFVFYSRYYIQEIPFVFFTLLAIGAAWQLIRSGRQSWLVIASIASGFMMASKETWTIVAFAALASAWLAGGLARRRVSSRNMATQAIGGFILALAVALLLLTNFFAHPAAALDFVRAFGAGAARSLSGDNGTGAAAAHLHPPDYYLQMLVFYHSAPGPAWSEAAIFALGLIGIGKTLFGKGEARALVRFFAFDALLLIVIFSAIPYKTPWLILNMLLPLCVMAGAGADALLKTASRPLLGLAAVVIVLGAASLVLQSWRATHFYEADERNPYAYSLTSTDCERLTYRIEALAQAAPKGRKLLIKVIAPDADYWPLPWELRRFPNVGFWNAIPDEPDADVVIVANPLAEALRARLKDQYTEEIYGLRPEVLLDVEIRTELWDAMMQKRGGGKSDGR